MIRNYDITNLNEVAKAIDEWSKEKGFYTPKSLDTELEREQVLGKLMLITSELGEAAEAVRKNDVPNFEEEIGDVIIRALQLSGGMGIDIRNVIINKMSINEGRERRHGKETSL